MNRYYLFLCVALLFNPINAQDKKFLNLKRTETPPNIDGILNDQVWQEAEKGKGFVQFRPAMGVAETQEERTEVQVTYDDNAVYFSAYIHDKPENIMKQFTTRDNFGQADFFLISINPNNDGQNDTEFLVFSTGTQGDALVTSDGNEDWGWNAVWDSAVKIVDDGWIVEMKIPYSALRFSNQEVQTWGINFHRRHMRDNRQYTWNPIDISSGKKLGLMHGEIRGIENITPPTRLAFFPFASAITRSYDGETDSDISLGMDVKYGITENFTLDATLIPDFSQAAFDNVELNLGPFEQEFSEQRQFFKEGVDLFNKGDLFYSRRVGNSPTGYPDLADSEEVTDYPSQVKTLNAIKVSGRTKKSLGIGFFNAITEKTYANIENIDTNEKRKEVVEPLSNYNVLVIDKQFNGNSSISLVNTNVTRDGHFRDANVTAALFDITDKDNKYNYQGDFKMSNLNLVEGNQSGFSGQVGFNKVSGQYRFGVDYSMADKKYDINDMGIQFRNNFSNFSSYFNYRTFEPKGILNNIRVNMWFNYRRLFKPSVYTGKNVGININGQTKKLLNFGFNSNWNIGKQFDYWEPRTEGRFSTFNNNVNANLWLGTNRAKKFSISGYNGMATLFDPDRDVFVHWVGLDPRIRFTDKFSMSYSFNYERGRGGRGFVDNIDGEILYGQRSQKTITNSISGTYNFNSFHGLSLTFRNYWSTVDYDHALYTVLEDGSMDNETGHNLDNLGFDPNINFGTWNLDFRYSWQFAPGSQLTALYRNSLFNFDNMSRDGYFDSLGTLLDQQIEHIFSLRMVYYIDYNNIKSIFKKRS